MVNAAGEPTRDPEEFYADPPGAILPFGGHKGYGLSLCVELLAGALTGNGCSQHARPQLEQGMLSLFILPERLVRQPAMHEEIEGLLSFVKNARRAEPGEAILLPGEREAKTRQQRLRDGIPLDDTTWQQLCAEGRRYGIAPPHGSSGNPLPAPGHTS